MPPRARVSSERLAASGRARRKRLNARLIVRSWLRVARRRGHLFLLDEPESRIEDIQEFLAA
jgi:hypothetical protein